MIAAYTTSRAREQTPCRNCPPHQPTRLPVKLAAFVRCIAMWAVSREMPGQRASELPSASRAYNFFFFCSPTSIRRVASRVRPPSRRRFPAWIFSCDLRGFFCGACEFSCDRIQPGSAERIPERRGGRVPRVPATLGIGDPAHPGPEEKITAPHPGAPVTPGADGPAPAVVYIPGCPLPPPVRTHPLCPVRCSPGQATRERTAPGFGGAWMYCSCSTLVVFSPAAGRFLVRPLANVEGSVPLVAKWDFGLST